MTVPFRFTFTIEGDRQVDKTLAAYADRVSDLTPAWNGVDQAFRAIVREQFASEGAHGGTPWPALAARTQRDRQRHGFPPAHPILFRTGRLERSLTDLSADTISLHSARRYAIGSAVEYFPYHQSRKPRARLPRRAPIEFTADDRYELIRPIRLYLRPGR
jgi:phage gpG-like protein